MAPIFPPLRGGPLTTWKFLPRTAQTVLSRENPLTAKNLRGAQKLRYESSLDEVRHGCRTPAPHENLRIP